MDIVFIDAVDIPDAWFQVISNILDRGRRYKVQHGSFVGEDRIELDFAVIKIKYPYSEPYDLMLPQIPVSLGIPNPVANGYVEEYLPYLMTDHVKPNEEYTYGSRIVPQLQHFIDLLKNTPNTNQAVIQVAQPSDRKLQDPPCLRELGLKIVDGKLHMFPSFRSWCAYNGFPANLAGLAVLQKYIADEIGIDIGEMIATSKGLHIYGYAEEVTKIRCYWNKKDGK
ncbi:MAG TPA: thymidylate synthase [Thermoplasmatales archaeon]|nr:thymidylate synthase [Thermoplasmatales archaeon]